MTGTTMHCPHCGAPVLEGATVCPACQNPLATPAMAAQPGWPPPMTATMPGTAMPRPTGVSILAVLYYVGAALIALAGVMMFLGGAAIGSMFGAEGAGFGAAIGGFFGFIFLVIAALMGLVGYGFWTGAGWAWILGIILQGLSVLSGLSSLAQRQWSAIVGLAISGFILWYLLQPGVKRWFGRA